MEPKTYKYKPLTDIVELAKLLRQELMIQHAHSVQAVLETLERIRGHKREPSDKTREN